MVVGFEGTGTKASQLKIACFGQQSGGPARDDGVEVVAGAGRAAAGSLRAVKAANIYIF